MSGEIKGHTEALLSGTDVVAVEPVALLHRAETRILPDGPWPLGVHSGIGTTSERELPRDLPSQLSCVLLGVQWLHCNALHKGMVGSGTGVGGGGQVV